MSADVALVTGAGGGIGAGIAAVLARRGDHVVVADIDEGRAAETAAAIAADGGSARAVRIDVADVASAAATLAAVDAETPLTTLVNNAAVATSGPMVDVRPEDYDRVMGINVRGTFFLVQAALRAMLPRRRGSIVNVCSTSSFTASTSDMTVYDTSKAAVRMVTQAAAKEVGGSGVRVNGVAPGTLRTALTTPLLDDDGFARLERQRIPLGRLGEPQEIGQAVAFLSSDAASYVTGHVLVVDGGWLA
ncbi:SDR family NAD(P)-dependent oxidoreductase [Patulibacter defluvii]|uniref:SDR family NAD(P)-dependent oxidoreductase n=1 Tax=Patulibacter defluvii TaxID=3095358 RepID=UPI002A764F6A|nr:SDR family oxidoreductase [Patulibacter sp. DM4]